MELTGPTVPVVEGVGLTVARYPIYSVSASGALLYQSVAGTRNEMEFIWVSRSGASTPVTPGEAFPQRGNVGARAALSPDGTRIAYSREENGNTDIWIKDLLDGTQSRLTFSDNLDINPSWTPDGAGITYGSSPPESEVDWRLWSRRADGTGSAEPVLDGYDRQIASGVWSPDSEWLVLRTPNLPGNPGNRDILAMRPSGGVDPVPLFATEEYVEGGATISPDGRWMAYVSNETGQFEIVVVPFPDVDAGRWQISRSGGIGPVWAHNGSELFFVDPSSIELKTGEFTTDATVFRPGRITTLFTLPPTSRATDLGRFYDVSLDDERFLMTRTAGAQRLVLVQNFHEVLKRLVPN